MRRNFGRSVREGVSASEAKQPSTERVKRASSLPLSLSLVSNSSQVGPSNSFSKASFVHAETDGFEQWDDQSRQQSWVGLSLSCLSHSRGLIVALRGMQANANRTFKLSLARSISVPASSSSTINALDSNRPSSFAAAARDVSTIDSLLSRLELEQSRSTELLVSEFERRHKSLWDSIETSIKLAQDEQHALEQKRLKEVEQERRAEQMRREELERVEQERQRALEVERRKRVEQDEERERVEREKQAFEKQAKELEEKNSAISGKTTGPGSPKGDFERWTNEMKVSALLGALEAFLQTLDGCSFPS